MAATATNPGVAANESGRFRLWMAAAFFTIYFVWGTTYLAIRYAVETIPPIVTAGLRHTTAGLILLALAWSHGFRPRDRKSTRLNSSHRTISYAVFCLKKK